MNNRQIIGCVMLFLAVTSLGRLHAEPGLIPNSGLATPPTTPPGFLPPPLNPTGVVLETRRLSDGVYALMSNTPFADNAGFVVGDDAVLVIDSHFNGAMGLQIIDAVRAVSDLPIRYLLNTNAFGDHTFGNYVFPEDTLIVAHQSTIDAMNMSSVEGIARNMARTVNNDLSVFDGVKLRVPDQGFDKFWQVDLGGRVVQMHFFGPGMSPNDSVVYVPDADVAWTANLIFGQGSIPWARSGGIANYRETLAAFANTIQPSLIVSGHGDLADGDIVHAYRRYLADISTQAEAAVKAGLTMQALSAEAVVGANYAIAPDLQRLMTGFHRWNLQEAFKEASQALSQSGHQSLAR